MSENMYLEVIFENIRKRAVMSGVVVMMVFLAISFSIRSHDFKEVTGGRNLEATYHALLTIRALEQSPIENHWLLPTVSLGDARDKNIPWGATVPTKTGDYVYTSFTPPGFLAPYILLSTFGLDASLQNIAVFNFILGAMVSLLLYLLLVRVLDSLSCDRSTSVIGALIGVIISIFSREVLHSHGIVYWVHSFYQLVLVSGLYFLFMHLREDLNQTMINNKYTPWLIFSVFFGAWTEWSGYVFGIGLIILFWFGWFLGRPQRGLSLQLLIALTAAGILTLTHYMLAVGFEPALFGFIGRFLARSTSAGSISLLLSGYNLSFGMFIVVTFGAGGVALLFGDAGRRWPRTERNKAIFLLIAATIPLAENVIMLQHAGQFTFDRLKFLFPAAIIISLSYAKLYPKWRLLLVASLGVAALNGYLTYRGDLVPFKSWHQLDLKNQIMIKAIKERTDLSCATLVSNVNVRGYANLLLERGIYESRPLSDARLLLAKTGACSAVYLEAAIAFSDLPEFTRATIMEKAGAVYLIDAADTAR